MFSENCFREFFLLPDEAAELDISVPVYTRWIFHASLQPTKIGLTHGTRFIQGIGGCMLMSAGRISAMEAEQY